MSRFVLALCLLCACGPVKPMNTNIVEANCGGTVWIQNWPLEGASHVPIGTNIEWQSNPPASGSHFPKWAAFQEYSEPVPRGYYVHDLEHGAIVLLYNCAAIPSMVQTDCEALKQVLRDAAASLPSDGMCAAPARVRTVITPDPLITTPIAAVAWGVVYNANCPDLASLKDFVQAHYAQGPENLCAPGVTSF